MIEATWEIAYRVPNTLRSDTEESVVGTEWHQEAIGALAAMLRDVAARRGANWGVCEQVALVGLQHEDGGSYDPRPDVMVLRQPLPSGGLSSIHIRDAGVPLFIAEVASESTKSNDQGDKRHAYAAIGVPNYLVFDPDGTLLPVPVVAWRLEEGQYVPWPPHDGWRHSGSLDIWFRAVHPFVEVRDRDGTLIAPPGQMRRRLHEAEQRLATAEQARLEEARRRAEAEQALREAQQARAALEDELRQLRGDAAAD